MEKPAEKKVEIKAAAGLTHYQEALLKKRRRDDADKAKRIDARAKQKMDQGRQKKIDTKLAAGGGTIMPEVFVSNHMKQQRNFVHYKRNKDNIRSSERLAKDFGGKNALYHVASGTAQNVKEDALLLAVRIKGRNEATTPQCQKILSELGLRQINNAVFLKANEATIKKMVIVSEFISYGYPTNKIVVELIKKRGFLRKDEKKEAITNNVLIEELLGPDTGDIGSGHMGCICLEDVYANVWKCWMPQNDEMFEKIRTTLWPFQLASKRETMEQANTLHEATKRELRKKNTKAKKGGYVGFMGESINEYIHTLI